MIPNPNNTGQPMISDTAFSIVFAKLATQTATEHATKPDFALFAFVVGFFCYVGVLLFLAMLRDDAPTVTMRAGTKPETDSTKVPE